jgi:2,3-dihydroxybenzoate decarboxylase
MFGGLVNDFQSTREDGGGKVYFDTAKFDPFWAMVQDLDVPIYFHPRYAVPKDLEPGTKYGDRKHLLGAAVQFYLDLSFHLCAMCSSGVFDRFPKVQIVAGHLGEKWVFLKIMRPKLMFTSISFNLWRACHWYNNPNKKGSRPSKEDYKYYFTHNVHITTSGNYSTPGLKFCIEELGVERCLYAIGNTHFPIFCLGGG